MSVAKKLEDLSIPTDQIDAMSIFSEPILDQRINPDTLKLRYLGTATTFRGRVVRFAVWLATNVYWSEQGRTDNA